MKRMPFKHIFCLGLTIASCGVHPSFKLSDEDESSSKLANIPGEDSTSALLVGQGFNPVDGTVKGFCVESISLATQSGNTTGQLAEFRLLQIDSETALRESLGVSASASFKGAIGHASSRARFAESVNKNSSSRYLMVHTRVANQLQLASGFQYKGNAIKLLKQGDQAAFLRQCGSEFVYGRRTGGEFFAVFEFSLNSSEEDRSFSAALSAAGGAWKAAGEVQSSVEKFSKFALTEVKMYTVGGSARFPSVDSLSDFAAKFNTMVSTSERNDVTLELLTKNYDGVEPIDLKPNTEAMVRQRYVMEQLGLSRDAARELLNSIRSIKANPERFQSSDTGFLTSAEKDLNGYLNVLNEAAVNCFADVMQGCQIPLQTLPTVELPKLRFDQVCRTVKVPECSIPGDNGECMAFKILTKNICD